MTRPVCDKSEYRGPWRRSTDVCWHCLDILQLPESPAFCERCPRPGDCDNENCEEPGCLVKRNPIQYAVVDPELAARPPAPEPLSLPHEFDAVSRTCLHCDHLSTVLHSSRICELRTLRAQVETKNKRLQILGELYAVACDERDSAQRQVEIARQAVALLREVSGAYAEQLASLKSEGSADLSSVARMALAIDNASAQLPELATALGVSK